MQDKSKSLRPVTFAAGLFLGVAASLLLLCCLRGGFEMFLQTGHFKQNDPQSVAHENSDGVEPTPRLRARDFLYAAVCTNSRFLDSRAKTCVKTWGRGVSKIQLFSQVNDNGQLGLPVVSLPDVMDSDSPPHEKMFRMLQYMCTNHVDDFDWFLRAGDDVYVKVDHLTDLLRSRDKTKMYYMGHSSKEGSTSAGTRSLLGRSYCMGGPGVLLSRPALQALCPHLGRCLENVVTTEVDVELGRCVHAYLGIECTQRGEEAFSVLRGAASKTSQPPPSFDKASEYMSYNKSVTLYPVRRALAMHRLHEHYLQETIKRQERVLAKHVAEAEAMEWKLQDDPYAVHVEGGATKWTPFTLRQLYSTQGCHVGETDNATLTHLRQVVEAAEEYILSKEPGSSVTGMQFIGGYTRTGPEGSREYMVDFVFTRNETNWNKMTQSRDSKISSYTRVRLLQQLGPARIENVRSYKSETPITVIVPISLQDLDFIEFLDNFEKIFRSEGKVTIPLRLLVVFYGKRISRSSDVIINHKAFSKLEAFKLKYHKHFEATEYIVEATNWNGSLRFVDKKKLHPGSVNFITSSHARFDVMFLEQCRSLAIPGKQIYNPIPRENIAVRFAKQTVNQYPGQTGAPSGLEVWNYNSNYHCVAWDDFSDYQQYHSTGLTHLTIMRANTRSLVYKNRGYAYS